MPMLLLVASVVFSQESSTCNATQRSDWSVGGGLIKEITACKDFGACCSYCTSTELPLPPPYGRDEATLPVPARVDSELPLSMHADFRNIHRIPRTGTNTS